MRVTRAKWYFVLVAVVVVAVLAAALTLDVSTKEIALPAFLAFFAINLWYAQSSRKRGVKTGKRDWLEDVILTIVAVTRIFFFLRGVLFGKELGDGKGHRLNPRTIPFILFRLFFLKKKKIIKTQNTLNKIIKK